MKLQKTLAVLLALSWASLNPGAPATKKSPPTKSSASGKRPAARKTATKKSASAKQAASGKKSVSSKKSARRRSRNAPSRSWRSGQQKPTPERYREIQQALIDKGYLQGTPTGTWGPDSVDALKRFQRDQNLKAEGTLDSLSIIALGLGPKRASNTQTRSQP